MSERPISDSDFNAARDVAKPVGPILADITVAKALANEARDLVYGSLRFAVLNAVPHEYAAIVSVFGQEQTIPSREHVNSGITYATIPSSNGLIYVVLAGISGQGIAQAAAISSLIKFKCRHVTKIILVGIAAGQPSLTDGDRDVRLGDIVVGSSIIQYDHIKRTNGAFELRGDKLPTADSDLVSVVHRLRASQDFTEDAGRVRPWEKYIDDNVRNIKRASRPDAKNDKNHDKRSYEIANKSERPKNYPFVHFGNIGSASTLLKDGQYRDDLNTRYKTIAYEMEGAGLAIAASTSGFGYLVIRGICDYGDVDKNDEWQTYASVCAASFARALLETYN